MNNIESMARHQTNTKCVAGYVAQWIARSQKIEIYDPISISAKRWDLRSDLDPSFKILFDLDLYQKIGSTIWSQSFYRNFVSWNQINQFHKKIFLTNFHFWKFQK